MITRSKKVRVSAKAIVLRRGSILLMRAADAKGYYFLLPGGGQQNGETAAAALVRECLEETGALVKPLELRYVRDYIAANHEFAKADKAFHQVELMFTARFIKFDPAAALVPDTRQAGHRWVPLKELKNTRLYPAALKNLIKPGGALTGPIYLGDVN